MKCKVVIDNPFFNCDKIHPLQQRKVRMLLDSIDLTNVKCVKIFGSSISTRCNIDSDVDVYLELNESQNRLFKKYLPYKYDVWSNYSVDDRLLDEINKECVIVYQKEDHNAK